MGSNHPRVFISYSQDSTEHSGRVLAFATALRRDGIDVELDQFHADEIVDWPRWCNEQTSHACSDFVLCVCTAQYRRRIEGNVPPERGKGAYWEGSLLDDDLYDAKGNSRIIPVLFDDEPGDSIPRFLRGWTFCRLHGFALSDSGYEHLLRILTGQASVVKEELGTIPDLPPRPLPSEPPGPGGSIQVAPTRLRRGADHLFGREKDLAELDHAWDDPAKHVLTIVAWGGVGKTALVVEWMAQKARAGWPGFQRVFDWSFYSQGTREQGAASADTFVAAALRFFGDPEMAASPAAPWDKGARLAQLVARRRTLLVLDGVEPLQHPPGPLAGELKDPALEALLKGLAQQNPGLCLVTTRERVADLAPFRETTAPEWDLEHLNEDAGARVLHRAGARRAGAVEIDPDDPELKEASRKVDGHALTLRFLGGYLGLAHEGDIRQRDSAEFSEADREYKTNPEDADKPYGHAFKMMMVYEKWLASGGEDGQRQLAVLRLMGLFDRPADAGCVAALREPPAIAGLTEPLVGLSDAKWNITLKRLADCGLVSVQSGESSIVNRQSSIDAHPLIREYFAKQLREKNPDGWRAAHKRLFEHLTESTEDKPEPTLEDLQPLYQAVAHGCQAGLYQEAWYAVYVSRILRGTEFDGFYSTKKLGAIGADLGAVACFFEQPWNRISPALSEAVQAWLLNEAATRLRALGRLMEALEPMRRGVNMGMDAKNWSEAAIRASNLSGLELTLGQVSDAVSDAEHCVDFADRSGDAWHRMSKRTTLADALHQAGRCKDALEQFREAEGMQAKEQPKYPLLYSVRGHKYCHLLLDEAERAAWQCGTGFQPLSDHGQDARATLIARCREVEQRGHKMFEWRVPDDSLLDIGLDHLTLGRAALYRGVLTDSKREQDEALQTAREQLSDAVDGLRRAGQQQYIALGLLSRAWLRVLEGDADGAVTDLNEAWQIAERGPMRLFMADIHLHRARLFFQGWTGGAAGTEEEGASGTRRAGSEEGASRTHPTSSRTRAKKGASRTHPTAYPWQSPREDLAAARKLIEECGYHRRDEELADAERVITSR